MKISLHSTLRRHGPCLSTTLSNILRREYGLSEEAARQRVSRGGKDIYKLKSLPFPHRAYFVYLREHYQKKEYFTNLQKTVLNSKSSYSLALTSILSRGGIVTVEEFHVVCGLPIKQKNKISSEEVLKRFIESCLVEKINIPSIGECIAIPKVSRNYLSDKKYARRLRTRRICEDIVLDAIKEWSKRLGLVSYNKVEIFGDKSFPSYGTFHWHLSAPSYISAITEKNGKGIKPGFFVCDISLNSTATESSIAPYLNKIENSIIFKNLSRCMHVFVAEKYTKNCFNLLKRKGIIPGTVDSIFGKEIADGLRELINVLNSDQQEISYPQYEDIFNKLSSLEGAHGNLRGALFEFLVAEIVRNKFNHTYIDINKIIKSSKGSAEVDVMLFDKSCRVVAIECKSNKYLCLDEVKKWFSTRIPRIKKYIQESQEWGDYEMEFHLWTTGKISKETLEYIKDRQEETNKHKIVIYNYEDILNETSIKPLKNLKKILQNYFS